MVVLYPPGQAFPRGSGSAVSHAASVLALFAAATFLVRPPLAMSGAAAQVYDSPHTPARRFQVHNFSCSCRTKKVLNVTPLEDADCRQSFITAITTKKERHGMKVKVNQSTLTVKVPAKVLRKSGVSGFYLKFSTESNKKREKARHRTCYKVIMNKADKEACRTGLRCEATMTKRPRRLVAATFLLTKGHRIPVLVDMNRLPQRKRSSDKSKKKKKGTSRTHKIQQRNGKIAKQKQKQTTRRKTVLQISESSRCPQKSCSDWSPKVQVKTVNDQVTVTYWPINCLAEEMEITVQTETYTLAHQQMMLPNATTYVFTGVAPGTYRAGVRPIGSECPDGPEVVSENFTIDNDGTSGPDTNSVPKTPSVCVMWHPFVNASVQNSSGKPMIVIFYNTDNLNASHIEVALETENKHLVKDMNVPSNMQPINITDVPPGTYHVVVRAVGCKDCADYKQWGERCNAAYTTSSTIIVHEHVPKPLQQPTDGMSSYINDVPVGWNAASKRIKIGQMGRAGGGSREKPADASDSCDCRACCDSCRAYGSV